MRSYEDPKILEKALRHAAELIAEHSHLYDEVNTPDEWIEELINRARREFYGQDNRCSGPMLFA